MVVRAYRINTDGSVAWDCATNLETIGYMPVVVSERIGLVPKAASVPVEESLIWQWIDPRINR